MARPPEELLLGFARALRAAGVSVTADRERTYLRAVATVGLDDQAATYAAGRATLCGSPSDLERYDLVYAAWFGAERPGAARRPPVRPPTTMADLRGEPPPGGEGEEVEQDAVRATSSDTEVLRHRDIAAMSATERAQLARMFASLHPRPPRRPPAAPRAAATSPRARPCARWSGATVSPVPSATVAAPTVRDGSWSCSTSPGR